MSEFKEKAISFFSGRLYPIFIALTVFIGHTLSIELFSIILLFSSGIVAVLLCDDMRVAISPVLMIAFTFSYKTFLGGWLGSTSFAVVAITAIALFIASFFVHFIINKKLSRIKQFPRSALFWGLVALSIGFLLNGFFNFSEYKPINFVFAILLILSLVFIFFVFYIGVEERENVAEYVIYVLYVMSILLCAEMLVLLARDATLSESGSIIKESLILGWGMWNNVGGMLTMLLPIHFYYASTKKRGYIFYASAILVYITIVLTLSRSSLLFATIISIICVAIICLRGDNKRLNRIITLALALACIVIAVPVIIIMWDKISSILGSYLSQGLGDNGRFELYKHGFENFISHPIFGGGFDSCMEDNFGHGVEPNKYHNTIIELLATCGIVGFGAYGYHRYQTIKLFINKKKSLPCLFLGVSVLALLLTSLLDNHIFNIYPTMLYAIILVALEKAPKSNE